MAKIIGNTTATPNPRPDWGQTDATKADYIKNKPPVQSADGLVNSVIVGTDASTNIHYSYVGGVGSKVEVLTAEIGKFYNTTGAELITSIQQGTLPVQFEDTNLTNSEITDILGGHLRLTILIQGEGITSKYRGYAKSISDISTNQHLLTLDSDVFGTSAFIEAICNMIDGEKNMTDQNVFSASYVLLLEGGRYGSNNTISDEFYMPSYASGLETVAHAGGHTEGLENEAGYFAHAEGNTTKAIGEYTHSEGYKTHAVGVASHTEGSNTKTFGQYAHAEGEWTTAKGRNSHTEGYGVEASGDNSHAEGKQGKAIGSVSHVEGLESIAEAACSHAEGVSTKAKGYASHTQNYKTLATHQYSTACGIASAALGDSSFAIGRLCSAGGVATYANGELTPTEDVGKQAAFAGGMSSIANGEASFAFGKNSKASGENSVAFGGGESSKSTSFSFGNGAIADGVHSVAFGDHSKAAGLGSVAIGFKGTEGEHAAMANYSVVLGRSCFVDSGATCGIATGHNNTIYGPYSATFGRYNTVHGKHGLVGGIGNTVPSGCDNVLVAGGYASIDSNTALAIGNGSSSKPNNALMVSRAGDLNATGNLTIGGNTITIGTTTITEEQLKSLLAMLTNNSDYTISGKRYFNDTAKAELGCNGTTMALEKTNVNFTSNNGQEFVAIACGDGWCTYYDADGAEYPVHESGMFNCICWEDVDLDFGTEPQNITVEFKEWLDYYTTDTPEEEEEEPTYILEVGRYAYNEKAMTDLGSMQGAVQRTFPKTTFAFQSNDGQQFEAIEQTSGDDTTIYYTSADEVFHIHEQMFNALGWEDTDIVISDSQEVPESLYNWFNYYLDKVE
jgi:hypothetical protein